MDLLSTLLPADWLIGWEFRWRDVVDVALMSFFVYQAYIRFRGTRAARIGAGLAVLGLFYLLAQAAGLLLTSWVLGGIWAAVFILVIVVFQAEIRQILEHVNPVLPSLTLFRRSSRSTAVPDFLIAIAETCFTLAGRRWGALFIFERRDPLEGLFRSQGVLVDARVSPQLLETFFSPQTPLHDGALYLRNDRVCRAGCVLPLSETRSLPYMYGTRHRAAFGITERSDAIAVVVSEESGVVSVVDRTGMRTVPGPSELLDWLTTQLLGLARGRKPLRQRAALLTRNWRPKLGALAIVGVLWLILVGPQNTEVGFTIPVIYYNIPPDLNLTTPSTQEVHLRVRGSRELLLLLDPGRLRVQIDLSDARAGRSRYPLTAQDVNLPLGVQVAGVDPSTVRVRLKKKPPPKNPEEESPAAG